MEETVGYREDILRNCTGRSSIQTVGIVSDSYYNGQNYIATGIYNYFLAFFAA